MNLTSLTFLTFGKLQASLIFRSLKRKVNSAHLAYRKRSRHSHIVAFFCSVPCFSQLCPIIVRSILELSVESLVTNWGVDHVCVRTECFVRKWFSLKPRCKDTTSPQTNHTFLAIRGHFYQGFAALECLFSWCYMNFICWTEVCKLLRISLLGECPLWTSVSVSVVSVVFWGVPISLPIYILLIIS